MLIVASGSGAAMPHKAVVERGFKGKIYQTHAAATRDLMRVGGKDVEGAYVVSGPVIAPEQLPDSHPSKKLALDFVNQFEKANGPGSRNQFAGHSYDALVALQKAVPIALKKAKPGTKEFRAALEVADYGYVLEMGELGLNGPAAELAQDPRVIDTYLGAARKAA